MTPALEKSVSLKPETAALLDILYQFQKIDPEFPLQYAICLAEISCSEGMSVTGLAERTQLSLSTVSRIVGALSSYRQSGEPYGLVDIRLSAVERRRKELYLTPKGKGLLQKITKTLVQYQSSAAA